MLKNFLIMFLLIVLYRISFNLSKLFRTKKLLKIFITITHDKVDNRVYETKNEVIELFLSAGIKDAFIPVAERRGSVITTYTASLFNAYPTNRVDFFSHYITMFDETIGTFKHRIFETFNPFFWINFVLFLPKNIIDYLGLNTNTVFVKILNLIFWICTFLLGLFQSEFKTFILSHLPENFFYFK